MLIEFRVKNFRSFREEQVLSFVAGKDKTLQETNTTTLTTEKLNLLRSSVIYGPNAGGKSNLIKAIQYMRAVVIESASSLQPGQNFNVQPFRLDEVSTTEPTEFEITLVLNNVRYQYGFALTSERIISEHLLVYKTFKPQRWFQRDYDTHTGKDNYVLGSGLKGQKNLWEQATRSNSLFLSMAVLLNSEQLQPLFNWFTNQLVIFNEFAPLSPQVSIQMLRHDEGKKNLCGFLSAADISISDISVITRKVQGQAVHFDLVAGKTEIRNQEVEENELRFQHSTEQGQAEFGLMDESSGTRNLLFLAGPILKILAQGLTLIVDELDTSLHPMLVSRLIQLFHNSDFNRNGAQLIFTTHDTSLLDVPDLFRRDQIWFVEKDNKQISSLYSLLEFSPRKNEALGRGYLIGRYGGLPFLSEWKRGADGTR